MIFLNRSRTCRDTIQLRTQGAFIGAERAEMTSYNRSRTCRDDFISWLILCYALLCYVGMTLYQSEQTCPRWPSTNLSRFFLLHTYIASCDPVQFRIILDEVVQPMSRFNIQILYLFHCPPTSWLHTSSPSIASIVSCAAFAVSQSMTSCSTDVSLRHTSTIPRVSTVHTLPWPNQPMPQAPLRRLQTTSYHSPETSDWSSEDASSRVTTPLQKLITRIYFLKVTLQRTFGQKLSYIISREEYPIGFTPRGRAQHPQGLYTTDPCHHCLRSCGSLLFICLIFITHPSLRSHFTIFVDQHVSIHCLFRMGGSD